MANNDTIICDKCRAINRVPIARLSDHPKCGKCRKQLFDGGLLGLGDSNFQQLVDAGSQPLLIMFWAPWCGHCQKTLPAFRQAAQQLEPSIRLATLNTEMHKFSASRSTINGLPTFVLYKNSQEIARQPGAMTTSHIVNWAKSKLQPGK